MITTAACRLSPIRAIAHGQGKAEGKLQNTVGGLKDTLRKACAG